MGDLSDLNFDSSKEEPSGFDALPAGDYLVVVSQAQKKATNKGDGQAYLGLVLDIVGEKFRGRKLFMNLNLWNRTQKAVEIAKAQLSSLSRAVGIAGPLNDSQLLLNKPCWAKVTMYKREEGQNGAPDVWDNEVKSFKPYIPTPQHPTGIQAPSVPVPPVVQAAASGAPVSNDCPF